MTPGVYGDLAVGVDPDGADAWAEQETTAHGSRIGAPPDPFAVLFWSAIEVPSRVRPPGN